MIHRILIAMAMICAAALVSMAETPTPAAVPVAAPAPAGATPAAAPAATPPAAPAPAAEAFKHTSAEQFKALKWDVSQRGRPLDLSKFKETFRDDFKAMSITPEDGPGPWYAPVHGPFGVSEFLPPTGKNNPFSLVADGLQIRAEKGPKRWRSGLAQTVNKKGEGFAQQYGYFEMTARFPAGPGAWPAFWLLSRNAFLDRTQTRTEIDVIEWYGGDPKGHHCTVHLWPAKEPQEGSIAKHIHIGQYFNLDKAGLLTGKKWDGFHQYGAEITPEWVIVYLDRKELHRFPTVAEFRTPLYLVIDLAILEKEAAQAASPMDMVIRNVTAYQAK